MAYHPSRNKKREAMGPDALIAWIVAIALLHAAAICGTASAAGASTTAIVSISCGTGPEAFECALAGQSIYTMYNWWHNDGESNLYALLPVAVGVRIEMASNATGALNDSCCNADACVSADALPNSTMSNTSLSAFLATLFANLDDIMHPSSGYTPFIDRPFSKYEYSASTCAITWGTSLSTYSDASVIMYDAYLEQLYTHRLTSWWFSCLPTYGLSSQAFVRPFAVPKVPGVNFIEPLVSRRKYGELRRCHAVATAESFLGYAGDVYGPYQVVESIDSYAYPGGQVGAVSARFCRLTGKTFDASAPASDDTLLSARTVHVRIPPTLENFDAYNSYANAFTFIYVLDGTLDVLEGTAQAAERWEANGWLTSSRGSLGSDAAAEGGYGNPSHHAVFVGVPFDPRVRTSETSPVPCAGAAASETAMSIAASAALAAFLANGTGTGVALDADGDQASTSPTARRSWPDDAPAVTSYASGSAGLGIARYAVNDIEPVVWSTITANFFNVYETPSVGRRSVTYSRAAIGCGTAGLAAAACARRRLACGSFDLAIAFDAPQVVGGRDAAGYIRYIGRDSLEYDDILKDGNSSYASSYPYLFRADYAYLGFRQQVPNSTAIGAVAVGLGSAASCDAAWLATSGGDGTNKEYGALEITGSPYGDWRLELWNATIDAHKFLRKHPI